MNNKSLKGFTLVELLIVVAIIGVLASVALPSYRVATEKARVAAVLPTLRKIREAQQAYFMEYRVSTCDLRRLNIKVNYVNIKERAVTKKRTDGTDEDVTDENGAPVIRLCGISYDATSGLPDGSNEHNGMHSYYDFTTDPPTWKSFHGLTQQDLGPATTVTLPSKDVLSINAGSMFTYNHHSNNLWIDYHLLGTIGENAGQWSYTGQKKSNGRWYNACDGVCYARTDGSIWDNVCRGLANGRYAATDANTHPDHITEDQALRGSNGAILWCIGGKHD